MPEVADVSEDELDDQPTIEFTEQPAQYLQVPPPRAERQQLWEDPADETVSVSLKASKRTRKLARGKGGEDRVSGSDLQVKLREQ